MRPSGPVRVAKNPMTKDPTTLMISVPHGKGSPKARATTPEHQKRAAVPSAPPSMIQRYRAISSMFVQPGMLPFGVKGRAAANFHLTARPDNARVERRDRPSNHPL